MVRTYIFPYELVLIVDVRQSSFINYQKLKQELEKASFTSRQEKFTPKA